MRPAFPDPLLPRLREPDRENFEDREDMESAADREPARQLVRHKVYTLGDPRTAGDRGKEAAAYIVPGCSGEREALGSLSLGLPVP